MTGTSDSIVLILAAFAIVVALFVRERAEWSRRARGFTPGRTVALDSRMLRSPALGLSGRPDRLLEENGYVIPEEWKSGGRLRPWHEAQLGVYFLLIEEEFGLRPPHGYVVCGEGVRYRVDNTDALRHWVLATVERMRAAWGEPLQALHVVPRPEQCAPCDMRDYCRQACG
jgi:CRISPR-associated exonuclease Cas4